MSRLPRLDPAARSAIWGVSGSGKSTLAREIARNWAQTRAVVVVDPTGPDAPALPKGWTATPGLTPLSPATPDECSAALLSAYLMSSTQTPVTVIADEAPHYLAKPSDAILKVIYQGRHRGLGLIMAGQRPSAVAPAVRSQVTKTIYMRLTDRADLNIVAASSRDLAAALPKLNVGKWQEWPVQFD
ncbi:hypothetical protein [Tateyamaria sp.]|uniref:hypothetical protein n=1 Tax=Tateyamaria sp. TaxID=1929288 RepID=UPI003B22223B